MSDRDQAGHPCMRDYCIHVLRYSEDVAAKRIQAAKAAYRYPVLFEALADGRLHLSGICLLAPRLLPENADDLITSAMNKSKAGIEKLLAERFPQADLAETVHVIAPATTAVVQSPPPHAPGHVGGAVIPQAQAPENAVPVETPSQAPGHAVASCWPRVQPLAPQRYGLQVTIDERTHDLLREAQDLLAHTEGGRQISHVLMRALELLVRDLKQRRFAETQRPRRASHKPKSVRTIPAEVKRAVRLRDGGRCTFMNATGERCPATSQLEYDHDKPVALGGETTLENVRLRCRAHNQLAAEKAYGEEFMRKKRQEARCASAKKRPVATGTVTTGRSAAAEAEKRQEAVAPRTAGGSRGAREAGAGAQAAIHEKAYEVIPWLRQHSTPAPGLP